MQTAPQNWDKVWQSGSDVEFYALIGGTRYEMDQFLSVKAYPAAFSSFAIGQAVSSQLSVSFSPLAPVPKTAEIKLFARLTNQRDITTDWVPQGTYYTHLRDTHAYIGILSITAFDRIIFSEDLYFSSGSITGTWPKAAPGVVSEICQRLGLSQDSRTAIDSALMVPAPVNLTMRDVLREIAAAHGGNFIITPSNKLRLLILEDLPDLTMLGDENGDFVADEYQNRVLIIEGDFSDMRCEEARSTGDQVTVSKVVLKLDDEHAFTAGDDTGYTLTADCLCADQAAANRALSRLKGVRYNPAEITGADFNPLLELGDAVYSAGNLFRVYRMEIDYNLVCNGLLSAPIDGDVEHEIPYQTSTERLLNWKAAQTRSYIDMSLEELELGVENELEGLSSSINIKLDSITSRVQGAEGNISTLTQTANSLQSQITSSDGRISSLTQTVNSFSSEISGLEGDISSINQKVNSITLSVYNGTDYSEITLSGNGIGVQSETIRFTGDVVFESDLRSGNTTISGDCITTGEVSADYIRLGGQMTVYQSLYGAYPDVGGYLGYINGQAADGSITQGIGVMNSSSTGQLLCSSGGARIGYGRSSSVTCTSGQVYLTANTIVANGTLTKADGTVITSDRGKKEDIRGDLEDYLPLFDRLRPVSYRLKGRTRRHLGFIAQEVEEGMEETGIQSKNFGGLVIDSENGYGLRYEEFIPLLVKKIQQLEAAMKEIRHEGKTA